MKKLRIVDVHCGDYECAQVRHDGEVDNWENIFLSPFDVNKLFGLGHGGFAVPEKEMRTLIGKEFLAARLVPTHFMAVGVSLAQPESEMEIS